MSQEYQHVPDLPVQSFSLQTPMGTEFTGVIIEMDRKQALPVVYALGWGTNTSMHKDAMQSLAKRGYNIFALNPPRVGTSKMDEDTPAPQIELNKADAYVTLLRGMRAMGIEEVDMVAHSEGAIQAVLTALVAAGDPTYPVIRSLVLLQPASSIGNDTLVALFGRFTKQALENLMKDPSFYMQNRRSARGILSIGTSFHEVRAIAKTDLTILLKLLEEKDPDIKVGIIGGEFDDVFPAERIERTLEENQLTSVLFVSLPIHHNAIFMQSEEVTKPVDVMIHQLHEVNQS